MKPNQFKLLMLVATFCVAAGCVSDQERRRAALIYHVNWPNIRAAVQNDIARREGNTLWSATAYYQPEQHTNGVWYVVASGAYPSYGDSIDVLVKDSGEIVGYEPRYASHRKWNVGLRND